MQLKLCFTCIVITFELIIMGMSSTYQSSSDLLGFDKSTFDFAVACTDLLE
jgi:hypothetical protein